LQKKQVANRLNKKATCPNQTTKKLSKELSIMASSLRFGTKNNCSEQETDTSSVNKVVNEKGWLETKSGGGGGGKK
jgi:hypothetical protein